MPHNYRFLGIMLTLAFLTCNARNVFAQDLANIGQQKPVTLSGALQLSGIFYNATGIPKRSAPFTYILSGNPTLDFYGFSLPTNFILSQQDHSFQQPFNQFGVSPQYKWITLHVGYRSLTFSPYTLAGYTMLGAGVELNPGKFHAGFMYGRLNRATKLDTATQSVVPYSFSRKAYAAKIGYGTFDNFLEFSMLKGKDDASSGPKKIDSLTQLVLPAANTVGGVSARITLFKKLFIEGNGGASIYTRDINSPIKVDSNSRLINLAKTVAIINGTTEYYFAYDAALGYRAKTFALKFQYVRVDPDFKTFGAYFFDNDLERYSFAPNFRLLKNRVRFNGSIGFQHDNVKNQKQSTTHKVVSNATLSTDITRAFGIDVTYTNFSNNQQPKTIVFADSLKIAQTTQNLSITPRLFFSNKVTTNAIIAGANIMKLNDYNSSFTQGAVGNNIDSKQFFVNYTYGYIPAQFNVFANINTIYMHASGITDKNTGFTVGVSKAFFKSALKATVNGGLSHDVRDNGSGNVLNSSGNLQYNFLKRQSFNVEFFYTNNEPKNTLTQYPAFTETRIEFGYTYNFR